MGLRLRLKVVCNLGKRVKSVGKVRTHVGDSAECDTREMLKSLELHVL